MRYVRRGRFSNPFLLFGIILVSFSSSSSQTYLIPKISSPPIMDGNLSDWNTSFSLSFVVHNTGLAATQSTFVSLAWDPQFLYLAYHCVDSKIVGSAKTQDAPIFNTDDLVEFFIDPDGDSKNYVEIGVNAFSTDYDILIQCATDACGGWKDDITWDATNMQTVAAKTPSGYDVEIKIPFTSLNSIPNGGFTTPQVGTVWKGNAFRIDYGSTTEYLAISAYPGDTFGFHQPTLFKSFRFTDYATAIHPLKSSKKNPTHIPRFEILNSKGRIQLVTVSGKILK